MNHPKKAAKIHWQPVAFSSSYFSATEQRFAQIMTRTLAIMHAFRKFDQLPFGKSGIAVHNDHKPLVKFSSVPWPLPRATCKAWCPLFSANYSPLNIAGIFRPHCWQPSSCTTSRNNTSTSPWWIGLPHGVSRKQNFRVSENLLCRKSKLKQAQIRPVQKALRTFMKTGWLNDKASVRSRNPCWPVRHEITIKKDFYSNKTMSSYLPRFDQTFFTFFMQLTVVPIYPPMLS